MSEKLKKQKPDEPRSKSQFKRLKEQRKNKEADEEIRDLLDRKSTKPRSTEDR